MNKAKKSLIIFLSICFILIICAGIKQTLFPDQLKSPTVEIKKEKTSSLEKNDNASKDKQDTENKTEEKAEETAKQENTKNNEDSSTQKSKAVTKKEEKSTISQSQETSTSDTPQQSAVGSQSTEQKPIETVSYNMVIKGKGNYLIQENITIRDGETVYNVLKRITSKNNIEMQADNSQYGIYVYNIGGLKAANYGGNSNNGWVYTINGERCGLGAGEQTLKSTDKVEWTYLY